MGVLEGNDGLEGMVRLAPGALQKPSCALTVGALDRQLLADFPASDAESWDRTGMTVGDPSRLVRKIAFALDPTVEAICAAADGGANVLVTHHPLYLAPPDSFAPASSAAVSPGAGVWCAIERGVAVLSFHTALDVSPRAQRVLPGLLGLAFQRVLQPLPDTVEKGYGQLCTFGDGEMLSLAQLAARCTSVFGRPPRVWGDMSRKLERVVTCTGSLADTGRAALRAQADCVVCGEAKYHEALELSLAGLDVIELGHDVSELPLVSVLVAAVAALGVPEEAMFVVNQSDNWSYPESVRV